jgi:hypothetical protein
LFYYGFVVVLWLLLSAVGAGRRQAVNPPAQTFTCLAVSKVPLMILDELITRRLKSGLFY